MLIFQWKGFEVHKDATGFHVIGGDTPKTLTVDETATLSSKAASANTIKGSGTLSVQRFIYLSIEAGGTPGTNINITHTASLGWNAPSITNATNLAASGTSGSFALSADGAIITMDIAESIVGAVVIFTGINKVVNSSTLTTNRFSENKAIVSSNLTLGLFIVGSTSSSDWRAVLTTAGDRQDVMIILMTAS